MSDWDELYKGRSKLDTGAIEKLMKYLKGEIPNMIPNTALESPGGGASELNDLNDVVLTSPAAGNYLRKSAGDWVNSIILTADLPTHNHPESEVTNLVTDLAAKEPSLPSKATNALKYLQVNAGETGFQYGAPTASVNIKETEIDFGTALDQTEKVFTITDADVSSGSQIIASLSYQAPTSKDQDEVEMDDFSFRCMPGTGQFDLFITSLLGAVHDKFKVNYLVG